MTGLVIICVFVASWLLTHGVRNYAIVNRLLDTPNPRSSHTIPTPSGGGVAIVAAWLGGAILLTLLGRVEASLMIALLPPATVLAAVGFFDDSVGLSPWVRIVVHLVAAVWFVSLSGATASTGIEFVDRLPLLSELLSVIGLIWLINLYNFMDGIDGLAAGEAAFVALGIAILCWLAGSPAIAAISAMLAAASAGFLIWNWPPARIFMGDTGSSWVGFMLGAIAISGSAQTGITAWPWVILLGVFLVDASVTLLRRVVSGQKWYEAHRSHAYQILSRRWDAHRPVTLVIGVVNVGWLLPMAVGACYLPEYAAFIAFLALVPLVAAAIWLGAGRPELIRADKFGS